MPDTLQLLNDRLFDPDRDIVGLRGDMFPGLSERQQDHLMRRYESEVIPLQVELEKIEGQRLMNESRRLSLRAQEGTFKDAQRKSRMTREILERMPILMGEVNEISALASEDPGAASERLLALQADNADAYTRNDVFKTMFDATQNRVSRTMAEAESAANKRRTMAAQFISKSDPALIERGIALLPRDAEGNLSAEDEEMILNAELLREASERETVRKAKASDAQSRHAKFVEREDSYLKEAIEDVGDITLTAPDPMTASAEELAAGNYLAQEDADILDRYVRQLGIQNPHPDPMMRVDQVRAALILKREQLHNGTGSSMLSSKMRRPKSPAPEGE